MKGDSLNVELVPLIKNQIQIGVYLKIEEETTDEKIPDKICITLKNLERNNF